jgi:hypothetical protein
VFLIEQTIVILVTIPSRVISPLPLVWRNRPERKDKQQVIIHLPALFVKLQSYDYVTVTPYWYEALPAIFSSSGLTTFYRNKKRAERGQ